MKGREIEPGWLLGTVQYGKWEENINTCRESHELVCTGVADVNENSRRFVTDRLSAGIAAALLWPFEAVICGCQ